MVDQSLGGYLVVTGQYTCMLLMFLLAGKRRRTCSLAGCGLGESITGRSMEEALCFASGARNVMRSSRDAFFEAFGVRVSLVPKMGQ